MGCPRIIFNANPSLISPIGVDVNIPLSSSPSAATEPGLVAKDINDPAESSLEVILAPIGIK